MLKKHFIVVLGVSLVIFIFDLSLKYLYILNLPHNFFKEIIPGFLAFVVEKNQYIAFSIPVPQVLILVITPIILLGLIVYLVRYFNSYLHQWGIMFLIFGALSNWLDRIYLGCVIDFIKISIWPIFNLADILIVIGIGLLILGELSFKKNK